MFFRTEPHPETQYIKWVSVDTLQGAGRAVRLVSTCSDRALLRHQEEQRANCPSAQCLRDSWGPGWPALGMFSSRGGEGRGRKGCWPPVPTPKGLSQRPGQDWWLVRWRMSCQGGPDALITCCPLSSRYPGP